MKTRCLALLCVLALVATACGSRLEDDKLAEGDAGNGPSVSTAGPTDSTPQASDGQKFGDIENPCGPGTPGPVPEGAKGVTATSIKIAVISDTMGQIKLPTASIQQSMEAFVGLCNEAGGINGRTIELVTLDSALSDHLKATREACNQGVYAIVGSGSVFDDTGADAMLECGLIEVPAYTATAAKAMSDNLVQPIPNPTDKYNTGPGQFIAQEYPEAIKKAAMIASNISTATVQAQRTMEAYESIGFEYIYNVETAPYGVESYATQAREMKALGVEYVTMVSATSETVKLLRDMKTQGFEPEVIDLGPQYYDPELLAAPESEGALVYSNTNPFEETDESPALTAYRNAYDKVDTDIEPTSLGVQAFSAGLLFATAANAAGDDLSHENVLAELHKITDWTGGGLHYPTRPGTNDVGRCFTYLEVKGGEFVRLHPTEPLTFDCDDSYAIDLDGDYGQGAKLKGQ